MSWEQDQFEVPPEQQQVRTWSMLLHLSQLLGYTFAPIVGFVAPVIIWQIQKDRIPELDQHGKNVTNWMLSFLVYSAVCVPLMYVLIGFVVLSILVVLGTIFPIIGAIKANNDEVWRYPLSIPFFK